MLRKTLSQVLLKHDFCVANSFFRHGPTYYCIGSFSWTECVFAPRHFVQHLVYCLPMTYVGRCLQVIPDKSSLRVDYHQLRSFPPADYIVWDKDIISLALQVGIGRSEFISELVANLRARLPEFNMRSEDDAVNDRYNMYVQVVTTTAAKHFSKHCKPFFKSDDDTRMGAQRASLLEQRRTERLAGHSTHALNLKLRAVTSQLHNLRRRYFRFVERSQVEELWDAYRARPRDTACMFRLSNSLSRTRAGRKTYLSHHQQLQSEQTEVV